MMRTLHVATVLSDKILVSRESARQLEAAAHAVLEGAHPAERDPNRGVLAVDFAGVEGVSPSFVDELMRVLQAAVNVRTAGRIHKLLIVHPPTRLSSKFEAIARGHHMSIQLLDDGAWELTDVSAGAP